MVDFKSRALKGMKAGQLAQRNNAQINQVLTSFREDMLEAVGGDVMIGLGQFYDVGGHVSRNLPDERNSRIGTTFEALFATALDDGYDDSPEYIIAEIVRGDIGYPCILICTEYEFMCRGKKSLIEALGQISELPSTGAIIERIRNRDESNEYRPMRRPL